jgi:hypothetical protein
MSWLNHNSVIFSVRLAIAGAIRTMTRGYCCCFIALRATQNEYCNQAMLHCLSDDSSHVLDTSKVISLDPSLVLFFSCERNHLSNQQYPTEQYCHRYHDQPY